MKLYRILIVIGIGLALVVLVAVQRARTERRAARVTLTDGTVMEWLGCARGGAPFTTEQPWAKVARRVLPRALSGWLPASVSATCGGGTNSLTVYVRVRRPAGKPPGENPWIWYGARDEAGHEYGDSASYCTFGSTTNSVVQGLSLEAFPRRQGSFELQFFGEKHAVLGRLRVPNPMRGPFGSWQAEGMPQTRTNGSVALTLRKVGRFKSSEGTHYAPDWEVVSTDPAWTHAKVSFWAFEDATGNRGRSLSPREGAWKLRPQLYRQRPEDFAAHEKFSVTNLAVPGRGSFTELGPEGEGLCSGVNIRVRVVAGASCLYLTNGTTWAVTPHSGRGAGHSSSSTGTTSLEYWDYPWPYLVVEVPRPLGTEELQVQVRDAEGREVPIRNQGWSGSGGGGYRASYSFEPKGSATNVTVHVQVSRPLGFEFTIDPRAVEGVPGS